MATVKISDYISFKNTTTGDWSVALLKAAEALNQTGGTIIIDRDIGIIGDSAPLGNTPNRLDYTNLNVIADGGYKIDIQNSLHRVIFQRQFSTF